MADPAAAGSWRSIASRAVAEALGASGRPGPVHMNLAFREPLVGEADLARELAGNGRAAGAPWHRSVAPLAVMPGMLAEAVSLLTGAGERGLIVAGARGAGAGAVKRLSAATGWPVLADPLSGCRRPGTISAADALVRSGPVREWHPDAVVRLGAPWASRALNEWLAELDCPQVLVQRWPEFSAPDRRQAFVIGGDPDIFCEALEVTARTSPGVWAAQWEAAQTAAQGAIDAVLSAREDICEPALARSLMRAVPEGSTLFVSSSMPVRDLEWWSEPRDGIRVLSNRGANGIDGVLSTALGVATAAPGDAGGGAPGHVVALVGDLAFLYDAGALLWAARRHVSMDIVVADNDGGGIFNFLSQAQSQPAQRFDRLWGTPHGLDLCRVAGAYGAGAHGLVDLGALPGMLSAKAPGVRVWVARTARGENVAVHESLHAAVVEAVRSLGL